ncbi:MAG: RibD family protein, partial [Paracoccaceae bacterium]
LTRILCEGGGKVAATLIKQDLIDRIIGFTGGKIFGSLGFPSIGTLGLKKINDMPCLKCINAEKLGNDVLHTWIVERDNSILKGL